MDSSAGPSSREEHNYGGQEFFQQEEEPTTGGEEMSWKDGALSSTTAATKRNWKHWRPNKFHEGTIMITEVDMKGEPGLPANPQRRTAWG